MDDKSKQQFVLNLLGFVEEAAQEDRAVCAEFRRLVEKEYSK